MRYEAYCLLDPHFYETPTRAREQRSDFAQTRRPAPDGWQRSGFGEWVVFSPDGVELPPQGWKIHVSACLDNAQDILTVVWDYCVPRRIAFKFLPSADHLLVANAKYAARGSSGKFVTIYPADEDRLAVVLDELGARLEGRQGPYILSDLRWGEGPLYVRYGGFAYRTCISPDGQTVTAIEDASGRLVPDVRGPTFRPPDWVPLPAVLEPHLAARAGTTVADLPYRIEGALHFSNGGGLYHGRDERTGQRVVLKEARPYAGLTMDGADAVTRQRHEWEALERMRGLDCVPALLDHFVLGGHHFLVEEYVEGRTLSSLFVERYPLVHPQSDEAELADYTAWALDMAARIEHAVAAVHDRGMVVGDLHTDNVLVRPDGRVVLIDFEGAMDATEHRKQRLAAVGFAAPPDRTGTAIDKYALACLRISLFMPLTGLFGLDDGKARQLAEEAARSFPVPRAFLAEAVEVINGDGGTRTRPQRPRPQELRVEPDRPGWLRARASMTAAILAAATPERDDRLFPGDIRQFGAPGGGLGIAYGAAGVLYALDAVGAGRRTRHEEWLVRRALDPQRGTLLGFYDGLHGTAYVLEHLGHHDAAMKLLDLCLGERWQQLGPDLHGGLAGIGLNLQHFAAVTGEPALRDAAFEAARLVADRLSTPAYPYAGLLHGSTGPALMFLRLYESTGEAEFLDLAGTALRQDLDRCVVREDGALEVDEGWRTMPYLADGSAGIGLVLDDFLTHREDERFREATAAIRTAASGRFFIQPGLFAGTAGMILCLSRRHPPGTAARRDPVVAGHVRSLSWHALTHGGHLIFPGEQLQRLSTDLATGSAGVLLAVGSALHDSPVRLPFLAPTGERGGRTDADPRPHEVVREEVNLHVTA
ncbi:class III lanthionine synthetase LanKC [Streptomyces sp. NRRL S-646]|uniref:class III lanthionine synthetase LanKC n=1 Tax=Streptomyces sp. NRRL S-646 TaxID=1463917 RepID=UPI002D21C4A7|nr:class III lanthionine synthetase LanKC [Streptomyces sp. NRRL S-646]